MSGEINVVSRTQIINIDPSSGAISIINAGPAGPPGLAGGPPGPSGPAGPAGPAGADGADGSETVSAMFNPNTLLFAHVDNTPVPLEMTPSTILLRPASGSAKAGTPDELTTLLALAGPDVAIDDTALSTLTGPHVQAGFVSADSAIVGVAGTVTALENEVETRAPRTGEGGAIDIQASGGSTYEGNIETHAGLDIKLTTDLTLNVIGWDAIPFGFQGRYKVYARQDSIGGHYLGLNSAMSVQPIGQAAVRLNADPNALTVFELVSNDQGDNIMLDFDGRPIDVCVDWYVYGASTTLAIETFAPSWPIPDLFDQYKIDRAAVYVDDASASLGPLRFQAANDGNDVFSTQLRIDDGELDSLTAAIPSVVNPANNTLVAGKRVVWRCTDNGDAPTTGVLFRLYLLPPS